MNAGMITLLTQSSKRKLTSPDSSTVTRSTYDSGSHLTNVCKGGFRDAKVMAALRTNRAMPPYDLGSCSDSDVNS
jgi:hypothetical protein